MEILQVWEVKYRIYPALSKSEEFNGYNFEVINRETYATKIYEKIVTIGEKRIKSKLVKKEPPTLEIMNDQQAIRNILLKRMIFTGSFSGIVVEPELSLKNQNDLEKEGFRLTSSILLSLDQPFSILSVDNDFLSTCEYFWTTGFKGNFNGLEEEVLFISDWIEKSVVEKQPIQSFMLLWVAFNCIYDIFSKKLNLNKPNNSFEKIQKSVNKLLKPSDTKNILGNHKSDIDSLISYNLIVPQRDGQTEKTPISFQLSRMVEENVPSNVIISQALRCVYEIRNNVFHQGSLNTYVTPMATVAKNFLLSVTTKMLRNMIVYF